ncbi:hypothetical protein D0Z67_00415 [Streptomyces seoulensis]|uniref:Uncharacterized protein n=1 Tax=Streptomyces seoulensis TaxID=73044 RepID=A0A4P6TRZ2_STRSO|nr:hypothetical protein D0Z67_00415 [Streptomyces seoulensis]
MCLRWRRSRSGQGHTRMTEWRERACGVMSMTLASFPVRLGACPRHVRGTSARASRGFTGRAAGAGAA